MNSHSIYDNKEQLLSHGDVKLRDDLLQIVESGILKVIPYQSTKELIHNTEDALLIGESTYPWKGINNIYFVGVGKGSFPIAKALDEILGKQIKEGVVIVKEGEKRRLNNIEVFESSHPIPDERSIIGADMILNILQKAREGDIVFAAITGGSSALVNKPAEGISISDLQETNKMLLKCGAEIGKVNAVRKHLCMIKGGRVVQYGQPATVITLTLDTAPPDMPWPDMCLPDPTTFQDAIYVLKSYNLWDKVSSAIQQRLLFGLQHPEEETLKTLDGMKHVLFSVGDPPSACTAAAEKAAELGYTPYILSTIMEGEARDVGIVLAGIVNEIVKYGRPFATPCALISGGETTVTISGEHGTGGPNQETALAFANKLRTTEGVAFLSMDTDGTDGPCQIAGGIIDSQTMKRIMALGINLNNELQKHNSSEVLHLLNDDIVTGHTGTNVMNLRVAILSNTRKE